MKFNSIIIGAGLAGICAAERLAREKSERVLVIEQRGHIGGNCHDGYDSHGILVQTYGPHIFHTDSTAVWEYLSRFTEWHPYRHRVVGRVDGRTVPIPFNLTTLHALLPGADAVRIEHKLVKVYGPGGKVPVLELSRSTDRELRGLAELVLEKIFISYSRKQWGLEVGQLDPEVMGRVPVVVSRDDGYFPDRYQGLPAQGYTAMFEKMLGNPLIDVLLDTPMHELVRCDPGSGTVLFRGKPFRGRLVVTGMIDAFFGFPFGELPYRALRFEAERLEMDRFQENAVVNYPNEHEFTRITEFKHMTGQVHPRTTVMREFPSDYRRGELPHHRRAASGEGREGRGESTIHESPNSESTNQRMTIPRITNDESPNNESPGSTNQRMTIPRMTTNESPNNESPGSTNQRMTISRMTNNESPNNESGAVPCYPILREESKGAAARYRELLDTMPHVLAVGRLAEFRYYDMDDLVERVLGLRL
jgi:UDP-galactopyranose mutase